MLVTTRNNLSSHLAATAPSTPTTATLPICARHSFSSSSAAASAMSYVLQQPIINYHAHTIHLSHDPPITRRLTEAGVMDTMRLSNEKTSSDALDSSKR